MSAHRLQVEHESGQGSDVYVRVYDDAEQVFDFDDGTFKSLTSATTPYKVCGEAEVDNLGSGRSLYGVTLEGEDLNGTGQLRRFAAWFFDNAAPAAADVPISGPVAFAVRFGEFAELPVDVVAEVNVRSTQGVVVQIALHLEHGGRTIDVGANGGAVFSADSSTDVLTSAGHGLENGDVLLLTVSGGNLPGGLSLVTPYYVVAKTSDTFQLALAAGGAAIDLSDNGSGALRWHNPTASLTVREHGAAVATYSKNADAADLIDGAFEFEFPDGTTISAVDTGTDTLTSASHGLANGQVLQLRTTGNLPAPLAEDTSYYVVGAAADTFQLAATLGGAAIDLTDAGSGVHSWLLATSIHTDDRQYELKATIVENGVAHTTRHRRAVIG